MIMDFYVFKEDLFKDMIRDLYFISKDVRNDYGSVVLRCSNGLKAVMDNKQEWGWEVDGGFIDEYIDVRIVKLYDEDDLQSTCDLKKVWTDAFNEKHLLSCYPNIFNEIDREMLTYNWDEFSSFIDVYPEQRRIEKEKEWEEEKKKNPNLVDIPF